ncbi:transcription elongation factor GreA [Candidatus Uhrbacteria bacterium]|nr:transcription elongation factor GreA [Candidatus Uhrbacteria bacterium]
MITPFLADNPIYTSKEGLEKLKEELRGLKTVRRKEAAARIEKAKELGDLSENAEYAEAKDELAFIEGRIIELEDYINRAIVFDHEAGDKVSLGSKVKVKAKDKEKEYTIVGPNEADPASGKISNETPLAKSLLGKKAGDEVEVKTPSGQVAYKILSVE